MWTSLLDYWHYTLLPLAFSWNLFPFAFCHTGSFWFTFSLSDYFFWIPLTGAFFFFCPTLKLLPWVLPLLSKSPYSSLSSPVSSFVITPKPMSLSLISCESSRLAFPRSWWTSPLNAFWVPQIQYVQNSLSNSRPALPAQSWILTMVPPSYWELES